MDKRNEINLVLYAVRNEKGEFFRAKGYGGGGQTWVSDINKAKIYGKIGGARGTITWFANNHPKYPTLELLRLTVGKVEVLDETERVKKAKDKKAEKEAKYQKAQAQRNLKEAENELAAAQAKLNRLKK